MPSFTVSVTDNGTDRLGNIGPTAREAIDRVRRSMTPEMYQDVLGRALEHIHTQGPKPGLYAASIQFGYIDKGKRMGGFVRSGSPLAHLLESGAKPPPHTITASATNVLAFSGDAGTVFRRAVQHPGATIPPYPAFGPAMEAHRTEITEKLTQALREAAAKR
jgi:hypothetical protein